jgi:hypothetical protein
VLGALPVRDVARSTLSLKGAEAAMASSAGIVEGTKDEGSGIGGRVG